MVKGLKVLRHTRTDAGYFNEFLIAKTPDDVENYCHTPLLPVTSGTATEGHLAANSQTFPQTSGYGSSAAGFIVSSTSSTGWQQQQQNQQHQELQQHHNQLTLLCFNHSDPHQQIIANPVAASSTSTEIARHEVVATSGYQYQRLHQTANAVDAPIRHQPDMAAGMSKMKLEIGSSSNGVARADGSNPRPSPQPPTETQQRQRRASRRRERNRAAAARCRKKRQDQMEALAEAVRDLEDENAGLEGRVAALVAARSDMLRRLREHKLSCPDGPLVAQLVSPGCFPGCYDDVTTTADTALDPGVPLDTNLASLATATGEDEILLTPSLLLPPPIGCDFKLEPL